MKSRDWSYGDGFANSVLLTKNLAFIGAPYDDERGERNNGCVFVFKRNGPNWQDSFEHTIIQPFDTKTNQQFGTSLALFNDKLVVGALKDENLNNFLGPSVSPNYEYDPASIYFFQAMDDDWNQYIELGQANGQLSKTGNLFGSTIHLDEDGLIAGAPYDNHPNGRRGGAVYHAPILNFPEITVEYDTLVFCDTDPSFQLEAALEGGKWKGPGVDEDLGTFNPQKAGVGKHALYYQGLSCFYRKHIYVDVSPNLNTYYKQDKNLQLCETNSASLAVNPVDSAHYQWFYLEEGKVISQNLEQDTSQIQIDQPGNIGWK